MNLTKSNKKRRRAILANTILNPLTDYDHAHGNTCAVGIGLNMMGTPSWNGRGIIFTDQRRAFEKFFGLDRDTGHNLYEGNFAQKARMSQITRQETAAFIKSV